MDYKDSGTSAKGVKGDKGNKGDKGDPGDDYVLTDADKTEIAEMVAEGVIGDVETALDNIIAIQENLIGGDTV
jgi:hypothetical protein